MRRLALSSVLVVAMALGLVNVDFSNLFVNPTETVSIGPDAAEARRGSSSRSFSRPSRPRPSRPRPTPPRAAPVKPKTAPPKAAPAKPGTSVAKPKPTTKDSATRAAARTQSQVKRAGATPKPAIRTSSGKTIKVAGTPAAAKVRSMPPERFNTRSSRREAQFSSIPPAQRTTVINNYGGSTFGDPFSGLFMYSLLSMSLHQQSMFHHNHWDSYSAQRREALIRENAQLEAELAALKGKPRDPNFVPEGVDPDLIYSDEFVNAAYNPTPVPVKDDSWGFGMWFLVLSGISLLGVGTYFVFFRRTEEAI